MKKCLAGIATAIIVLGIVGTANAVPIKLTWTTTVMLTEGTFDGIGYAGEGLTTTIMVDNGGTSTLSQTWDVNDFLTYRMEGASGWWIGAGSINTGSSTGSFSTDGLGNVIAAGRWGGYYPSGTLSISWGGDISGGWWNNGNNAIAEAVSPSSGGVFANDVSGNQDGANWTATSSAPVPEPATVALLGIGLVGLAGTEVRRRRKKKAVDNS